MQLTALHYINRPQGNGEPSKPRGMQLTALIKGIAGYSKVMLTKIIKGSRTSSSRLLPRISRYGTGLSAIDKETITVLASFTTILNEAVALLDAETDE
jgi:hypothetical protein